MILYLRECFLLHVCSKSTIKLNEQSNAGLVSLKQCSCIVNVARS